MTTETKAWIATVYDDGDMRHVTTVGRKEITETILEEIGDALDPDLKMGIASIRIDFRRVRK